MTTNQEMFLYAVEEMSFTRAAARAFVTQQCLSNHIRRLEESYGVRLFDRSPALRLTPAGERLYHAMRQIQEIERGVRQEFSGAGEAARGTVTLGIHGARARQLVPRLFAAYRMAYPNVRLAVVLDETKRLAASLLEGKIDLFLGVDCPPGPRLQKECLWREPIYLLASEHLLAERLPEWREGSKAVRAEWLPLLPLAVNPSVSTAVQAVERFFTQRDLVADRVCEVGDYYTQLALCRLGQSAAFCPESFLEEVFSENLKSPREEQVRVLRVPGLEGGLRVDLVTRAGRYMPPYAEAFLSMLREQYLGRMREIRRTAEGG